MALKAETSGGISASRAEGEARAKLMASVSILLRSVLTRGPTAESVARPTKREPTSLRRAPGVWGGVSWGVV